MSGGGGSGGSVKAIQYSWQNSPVSKMIVATNISGQPEATIYANSAVEGGALSELTKALSRKGMAVYFDEVDGAQVLKVQNFPNPNILTLTMNNLGATEGTPAREEVNVDGVHKNTWTKIREKGTNIAGALGIIGHAGLIASGAMAGDMNRVKGGLQYGTSAGILAVFGAGNQKLTSSLCSGLFEHLTAEGIQFSPSEHATPTAIYRERSGFEKGYDAFRKHSLLAANIIGVGGNIDMMKSGWQAGKRDGFGSGAGRFGHGAVNLVGASVASFVPETSKEALELKKNQKSENDKNNGGMLSSISDLAGTARDGIARAPLMFQGGIMLADNILDMTDAFHIKQSYERRDKTDYVTLPSKPDVTLDPKSKAFKEQEKAYKSALQKAGHYQRLEMNLKEIEQLLGNGEASKLHDLTIVAKNPIIEKSKQVIKAMEKVGGNSKELEALMADRKVLLQELVEKERFGKYGWVVAAAKVGAWTASSAFQMIAKKNTGLSTDAKYGEICANVATMALEVPAEQREAMVTKSAEYLAAQPAVYITADEIKAGILHKLTVLQKSPWTRAANEIIFAKAEAQQATPATKVAHVQQPERISAEQSHGHTHHS
jgi:hypothetical protein